MSVELLIGRAGSGRTSRVRARLRDLIRAGDRDGRFPAFQVLVPTYSRAEHLKRSLVRGDAQVRGIFDRGVGTFEQLAERVTGRRLSELAPRAVRDALAGRALEVVDAERFRGLARFPGFRRSVLRFVAEVKGADPPPSRGEWAPLHALDRLAVEAERDADRRAGELADLVRVAREYVVRLRDGGWIDHEDLLRELLDALRGEGEQARPLDYLAVDGFTDLTEVQERVVQLLSRRSAQTVVTLLGPSVGGEEGREGPFAASEDLRRRLGRALEAREVVLTEQYRASGDLARLERAVAGEEVAPAEPDGSVRHLTGADAADEADRVARVVKAALAEGVERRDVLVVVRHPSGDTAGRVLGALRHHGLEARWSGGTPLQSVPIVQSTVRVLRLLGGCERPGDLRAALHGGAARDVPDREADRCESEARVRGVHDFDRLRDLAAELGLPGVLEWLERLHAVRSSLEPASPEALARRLLEAVPQVLSLSFEGAIPVALERRAAQDAAALSRLQAVVGEVAHGLRAADRQLVQAADLLDAVEEVLPDERAGGADRRGDLLNVVDAEEARQWEARLVVVCGLRLGEFPGGAVEDLFVSDEDRARISRDARVRLPARRDPALQRERLLFYAAVTRATERLVLTTHSYDAAGDPVFPSPFLERALELLPPELRTLDGSERSPGGVRPAPGEEFGPEDVERIGWSRVLERHAEGSEGYRGSRLGALLLGRSLASPRAARRIVRAARAYSTPPAQLPPDGAAARWLARPRTRSASTLAAFAQCEYLHFARKGLGLDEPPTAPEDGLDPLRTGTLAHEFLELAVRSGVDEDEAATDLFEQTWTRHAGHLPRDLALDARHTELREALVPLVLAWHRDGFEPGFRPDRQEQAFGRLRGDPDPDAPPPLDPLVLGEGDTAFEVRGAIDRIDVDAQGRLLVTDYKWSRAGRYSGLEDKLERGQDLQAALYALALSRIEGRSVLASGYLTLRDRRTRWIRLHPDAPTSGGRSRDVDWSEDGAEHLAALERRLVALDQGIRAGRIVASPLDPDRCGPGRCVYAHLCRIQEAPPDRRSGAGRHDQVTP